MNEHETSSSPHGRRVQLQSPLEARFGLVQTPQATPPRVVAIGVRCTDTHVGLLQAWIELHGTSEIFEGDVGGFPTPLLHEVGTLQIEIVGVDTPGLGCRERLLVLRGELLLEARRDRCCDPELHPEDILVGLHDDVRPGLKSTLRLHQRERRQDLIAGDLKRPGEHGLHVELSSNVFHGLVEIAIAPDGLPWSHSQTDLGLAVTAWPIPSAR